VTGSLPGDVSEENTRPHAGNRDSAEASDFGRFVREVLPALLRYGHALTGNPHDAADLVQIVLEKVGSRWGKVVGRVGDPHAYTRRAVLNTYISSWRRPRREHLFADLPDEAHAERYSFENEPLWLALRSLPPRQRAVVVLRYYEGLTEVEIAEALGVKPGTVKSQSSRAMETLRTRLGTMYGGVSE
jgi:RNA polymerase sigma-70 factor (sigma-E family)